jgi:threonine/homoserine/homoserine lactone efflux protein
VPPASDYAVFLLAGLTLLLIPGPAVLYVVGQSIDGGRRVGLASVLGITTGTLVHITAAAAGLSALIVSSRVAFDAVRYAGAAYLIAIGLLRIVRRTASAAADTPAPTHDLRRAYTRGVVVNVLNPKTALFFLAFLPQFVTRQGAVAPQVAILGLTFATIAFASDATYALLSDLVAARFRQSRAGMQLRRFATGGIFVALGVTAAAARRAT